MKILALDTSRKTSDATWLDTETGRRVTKSCGEKNNESLLLMLRDVLRETEESLDTLDALCVCTGPGSFTGLRIGMTTMKSFAQTRALPLFGMSALSAMRALGDPGAVPLLDARGGRVYTQDETGASVLLQADGLRETASYTTFSSPGFSERVAHLTVRFLPEDAALSRVLAEHAATRLSQGERPDWRALFPDYVGVSQAEREREAKRCRD